jgi:hypothetical protein
MAACSFFSLVTVAVAVCSSSAGWLTDLPMLTQIFYTATLIFMDKKQRSITRRRDLVCC